jgi:hypothetical protein
MYSDCRNVSASLGGTVNSILIVSIIIFNNLVGEPEGKKHLEDLGVDG